MMNRGKILYGGLEALNKELREAQWQGARYMVMVDECTLEKCLPMLVDRVEALQEADFIELPQGEECKSAEIVAQVWQTLLESNADRQTVIVCLGGGALSDVGGFVAATYMRGLRHINIPTTLLAMTDAAIGGKTAINFGGVKNSIGVFYQPELICLDVNFLETLPSEAMLCGVVEMVKTAAVADAALYESLIAQSKHPSKGQISSVARLKNRVVKCDPQDKSIRKILNFGHTFGHAIEMHYGLAHGQSVGLGMRCAMYLSTKKVGLPETTYEAYSLWLDARVEKPSVTLRDAEAMLALMHHDKKKQEDTIYAVLLQNVAAPMIDVAISDNEIRDALLKL